jgi:hypothetical protein
VDAGREEQCVQDAWRFCNNPLIARKHAADGRPSKVACGSNRLAIRPGDQACKLGPCWYEAGPLALERGSTVVPVAGLAKVADHPLASDAPGLRPGMHFRWILLGAGCKLRA